MKKIKENMTASRAVAIYFGSILLLAIVLSSTTAKAATLDSNEVFNTTELRLKVESQDDGVSMNTMFNQYNMILKVRTVSKCDYTIVVLSMDDKLLRYNNTYGGVSHVSLLGLEPGKYIILVTGKDVNYHKYIHILKRK